MQITPIILAGGSGSRLWPLSRQLNPKQFLDLTLNGKSMLQETIERLRGLNTSPPILICNEQHRFLAAEQMREIGVNDVSIILEPIGRNTAPAIALAALISEAQGHDGLMLVLPADHLIADINSFHRSVTLACAQAQKGKLVTFGITPRYPETGYGYIKQGEPIGNSGAFGIHHFVEKPDAQTAQHYFASGDYLWNSGMFLFKADRYLEELSSYRPDIFSFCQSAISTSSKDLDFIRINEAVFAKCPDESIDYAVMEHTSHGAMVTLDSGWNDIGSWSSLLDVSTKDSQGNSLHGDIIAKNTRNTLVRAEGRLVTTLGVDNLIIVETKDAVLIAAKDCVQEVKSIVDTLKSDCRQEHIIHREVYRPWGVYDSIDHGQRYQVKRITVRPGAKLSVQMHHHRAEHWIIVSGTARVTNGDKTYLVSENQSTYIPVGQVHALENPGVIDLELIEVQSGSYLGEDDIVRFEDRYGRTSN